MKYLDKRTEFAKKFRKQRLGQPGRFAQLISYLISQPQHTASVKQIKTYLGTHNRQRFWQIVERAGGWLDIKKINARQADTISLNAQAIEFINQVVDFDE